MKSFKRAIYKIGSIEEAVSTSCDDIFHVDGEEGIYEVDINIGTIRGRVGINYQAFDRPDRFQLIYKGEVVADSLYVGKSLASTRIDYIHLLVGEKELPVFKYNGNSFISDGSTETVVIEEEDISNNLNQDGRGVLTFQKNDMDVTTMKLRVIGALGRTLWNTSIICPEEDSGMVIQPSPIIIASDEFNTIYHSYLPTGGFTCAEFQMGVHKKIYSNEDLILGRKVFNDEQMMNKATKGFYYLGGDVYEVEEGMIIDIFPCSNDKVFEI